MANHQNNHNSNLAGQWILTLLALFTVWPVGLLLLIRMLANGSLASAKKAIEREAQARRGPIDTTAREVKTPPVRKATAQEKPPKSAAQAPQKKPQTAAKISNLGGNVPIFLGAALLVVFGAGAAHAIWASLGGTWLYSAKELMFGSGVLATGLVLLGFGISRRKKVRRYRKYRTLIGNRDSLPIDSLAKAMPVSLKKACADLQDMLDAGYLPAGYVDCAAGRLVFSDEGMREAPSAPREPAPKAASEAEAIAAAIQAINDDIDDAAMSQKIDRIQEITVKILDYQASNPDSTAQLRRFLDYYLPTTLKLLRTYARLEEQGVDGENITATKAQIAGMMDKMVEAYEARLDKLFASSAVDISGDIAVLEQMLQRDGLAREELRF